MPKKDFAQELKEEFKKGNIKPNQIKRSKSTEHLTIPKPEIPLQKSKSAEEITLPKKLSLTEQIKQLKQDLVFSQNTAQNYLQRLQKLEPELDSKDQEIKKLAETNNKLVDKNNELRLQALKDDDKLKETNQGIKQAVEELVATEQTQINYQVQNQQLLREKSDLENQLKNSQQRIQKLYQLKGLPNTHKESHWRSLLFTGLLTVSLIYLIWPKENHE